MLLLAVCALFAPPSNPLSQLRDGDRFVLLGGTLIEREQYSGYWESALLRANPGKRLVVRNLGWSGDTVFGDARAGFDTPMQGYERLVALTKELKPTVIVLAYGQNESFAGKAGVAAFRAQYAKLLGDLAATGARLILMTPSPFEATPPLTDADAKNRDLALYADASRKLARDKGLPLIDLFDLVPAAKLGTITANGLHLTPAGVPGDRDAGRRGGAVGRRGAEADRGQEPAVLLPLAAAEPNVPVRLPQARAGAECGRGGEVRPAGGGGGRADFQADFDQVTATGLG